MCYFLHVYTIKEIRKQIKGSNRKLSIDTYSFGSSLVETNVYDVTYTTITLYRSDCEPCPDNNVTSVKNSKKVYLLV